MTGGQAFVIAIIGMGTFGWIVTSWIRAKHGFAVENVWGDEVAKAKPDPDAERKIQLLSTENDRLTGQISRLEERLAVLERIVTDPAERTAREIESLR